MNSKKRQTRRSCPRGNRVNRISNARFNREVRSVKSLMLVLGVPNVTTEDTVLESSFGLGRYCYMNLSNREKMRGV